MRFFIIVFLFLVNLNAMNFCKFKVDGRIGSNSIQIDGKYWMKLVDQCIDATGGNDCYSYKNKGYEYNFIWVDDIYQVTIKKNSMLNIFGKNETCWY